MPDTDGAIPKKDTPETDQPIDTDAVLADASLTAIEAEADVDVTPQETTVVQAEEKLNELTTTSLSPEPVIPAAVIAARGQKEPGKSKKPLFIVLGIIIGVLSLLGIGGAIAYAWYTNPEKVVIDSLVGIATQDTVEAQGTLNIQAKNIAKDGILPDVNLESVTHAKYNRSQGMTVDDESQLRIAKFDDIKLKTNYTNLMKGSDYYKVTGLDNAYSTVFLDMFTDMMIESMNGVMSQLGQSPSQPTDRQRADMKKMMADQVLNPVLKPIISALDGQWIEVRAGDFNKMAGIDDKEAVSVCEKEMTALLTDKGLVTLATKAYADHRFMTITPGNDSYQGSQAYNLEFDESKYDAFMAIVKKHNAVKAYDKCQDDNDKKMNKDKENAEKSDEADDPFKKLTFKTTMTVWVNQWSHQLTRAKFSTVGTGSGSAKTEVTADMTFKQGGDIRVAAPKDARRITELCEDKALKDFCQGFSRGLMGEDDDMGETLLPQGVLDTPVAPQLPNRQKT